ncbi:MAG: sensor histidine kinase [Gammaproteobacteria bacterium]
MAQLTEQRLALGLGLVLVLLVVNAVVSYRAARSLIDSGAWVAHTHQVLTELEATRSTMADAESGQRGFLITGEAGYLKPYERAIARIEENVARLKQLAANHAEQQRRAAFLEKHIAAQLDILNAGLAQRREHGFEAARKWTLTGGAEESMERIRTLIEEMKGQEVTLLSRRVQESRRSGREALVALAIGALLSVALVWLAYYLFRRDLRERERAAGALRAAHDELEGRVEERTKELAQEVALHRQAEENLRALSVELERSNRELQDFAFIASHDLQEPLRKILAFGDRLKARYGEALEAQGRDYLERMQNAARRMHDFINDLLTLSRVTTKARPFVPVALEEVAREVVSDLEARIEETGGRVTMDTLPTIEADPVQMRQLLQNLIDNALKFHRPEEPPLVQVRGMLIERDTAAGGETADNRFCEIAVTDNGIGIDEHYLDKVFTPFQRLHGRGEYEGTGMGLAVCRKIVERHGGCIRATSTPNEGATFWVTLPLAHSEQREKEGAEMS